MQVETGQNPDSKFWTVQPLLLCPYALFTTWVHVLWSTTYKIMQKMQFYTRNCVVSMIQFDAKWICELISLSNVIRSEWSVNYSEKRHRIRHSFFHSFIALSPRRSSTRAEMLINTFAVLLVAIALVTGFSLCFRCKLNDWLETAQRAKYVVIFWSSCSANEARVCWLCSISSYLRDSNTRVSLSGRAHRASNRL